MIGIVPAAGHASRLYSIPKMLLPMPGGALVDKTVQRLQTVCNHVVIGTNFYLYRLLKERDLPGSFVYMANTNTMSETVLLARQYALGQTVAFAMPDTAFDDDEAFVKLAAALEDGADVAVGLFRAQPGQHRKGGMCALNGLQVVDVIDKPPVCAYPWIWGVLAWKPAFWPLLDVEDPHVGYALPRAIRAGLDVRGVVLNGTYWDCGTPDDYFDCIAAHRVAETA